jgi:hypothetical protein
MLVQVGTETWEKAKPTHFTHLICGVISKVEGLSGGLSSAGQISRAFSEPCYTKEHCSTVSSSLSSADGGSPGHRAGSQPMKNFKYSFNISLYF